MKVSYDQKSDSLTVVFKEQADVAISDVVAIEILDASRRMSEATHVDFKLIKEYLMPVSSTGL